MQMYDCIAEDKSNAHDPKPLVIPGMRPFAWRGALEFGVMQPDGSWKWDYSDEKVVKAARLTEQSGVEAWGWDVEYGPFAPTKRSKEVDAEFLRVLKLARQHTKAMFVPYAFHIAEYIYCKPEELPPNPFGETTVYPDGTIGFAPYLSEILGGRCDDLMLRQLKANREIAEVCKCVSYDRYHQHPSWFDMINSYYEHMEGLTTRALPKLQKFSWASPYFDAAPPDLTTGDKQKLTPEQMSEYFTNFDRLGYWPTCWGYWAAWREFSKALYRWA